MATYQGSFGRVRVFEDFLAKYEGDTAQAATFTRVGGVGVICVSATGSWATVVDEPGGILQATTHTDDNDNIALHAGMFQPHDGGCVIEARFKVATTTTSAIFCGFSETLAVTTPVMPAEYSGTTLTCNGSGGMVGMLHDADATTDLWRAVAGDGGVEETVYAHTVGPTADYWDIVRVEIDNDGNGTCYINGTKLHTFTSCVTSTDMMHAVLMVENRSGAANVLEVDYFFAEGGRDWSQT